MKASGLSKEGWRPHHFVMAAVLMTLGAWITRAAWIDMYNIACNDEECGHALLTIPAFAWLAWIRRGRLRRCRPTGQWVGTLLIGIGWLLWSVGFRRQWQPFWHAGALVMVLGGLFTAIGSQVLWEFLPAFAVLGFMVPVPTLLRQNIAIPLQGATAHATQVICEALGLDVQRQNCLLTVNGVHVEIAEACNGMRMVFALILVCYLFAFVAPLRGYVRFLLLILSPIVAMIFNVVRLVPTVWVYNSFAQHTAETFHDISGWVMLIAAFLTLIGFLRVMRWAMLPVTHFRLI
jgi:exosortase